MSQLGLRARRGDGQRTRRRSSDGFRCSGARFARTDPGREKALRHATTFVSALSSTLSAPIQSGPSDFRRYVWLLNDDEHAKRQLVVTYDIRGHDDCWSVSAEAHLLVMRR
jgi:hypothetical protein